MSVIILGHGRGKYAWNIRRKVALRGVGITTGKPWWYSGENDRKGDFTLESTASKRHRNPMYEVVLIAMRVRRMSKSSHFVL